MNLTLHSLSIISGRASAAAEERRYVRSKAGRVKSALSFTIPSAVVIASLACFAGAAGGGTPALAATPPPSPPPITAPQLTAQPMPAGTSLPTPSATLPPAPLSTEAPSRTPTPPPASRKGIEGVWEVQIQHIAAPTDYAHFQLQQQGDALTGTYLDQSKKKYPLVGTVDGQDVRLIVSLPNGTTLLLQGRLDGTTDMVGMLTDASGQTPFTASYRAKAKWIENVNPSPGGIGQPGSYTPP